jgi:hypothetical protein
MNSQIALSNLLKNWIGILTGIALNLYTAFSKIAIFTILILSIHEHGRSFYLLKSSLISFFRDLKSLSYRSFTFLVRIITKIFYIFCDYCEGFYFPNLFLSLFILCVEKGHLFVWVNFIFSYCTASERPRIENGVHTWVPGFWALTVALF